ncbi:MAG: 3-oxoacyl-[acyl-carrier-protein] reductase [Terrisporobacter othiniensis]|uniref:3-oxoacyl-[acyl-carrier-protein] reductase n=2 Tax=Terrisporobacter TaxID=1505652 RepID=A0AAX2ZJB2_9FIRM|nr:MULTISPECIES: 3-oxoacyl-[acyl-carrier-protein] reductase [Terrisporobacter]MBN9648161.1 3-oxoacyl-[acyl-carrier-protein] reductase [Terrisporobacter glycolicus]MDU4861536.1 3-oxoacyl-[acyl-carrier-protein] reductase [Terrisporobacter othiniensis]MDU6995545.1 3-oxoacyl-[acyl-carrier-protein] reductase [Terrisporobacter othiniensis]UEL49101.1 3-oxoacyl-[acyl-carrier-protein] reductase [Terrisporobacter hibernicus]SFJ50421.1 3-oxoacyl-[acyl-carrier-protein] reductase [Terrisporobacter glycolic
MLQGKCAVITGASRGIGREIAIKYAKEGANIVLNYRNSETEALQLKEELDKLGSDTLIVKANVSNFEEAEKLIKEAKEVFGRVDILVNNAGITKDNLIMRMKEEDFDSVIDVNLKGAFNCLKAVTPIMIRQKSGKIINMSSVVGVIGNAGQVNYCASKAGLIGMTKSLAREIGGKNINVNAIAPGFIDTDMTKVLSEDQKKNIMSQVPLKRLGQAEDIANLALFLASNQSDYITGQVIHVDGGMAM